MAASASPGLKPHHMALITEYTTISIATSK
jgi:hypothetical protein